MIIRRRKPAQRFDAGDSDYSALLCRLFANRHLTHADDLATGLDALLPSDDLLDIDKATDLLIKALKEKWRILIVGDYDADGATSTAVAIKALHAIGAQHLNYLVPNRFDYGYGLSPELVEAALAYRPDLIITVDNGISSIKGVAEAKRQGIEVIVTDHHLPGEVLPKASAIVNPNRQGDGFPSKCLAGVGVVFYLMIALRARLREQDWFSQQQRKEPNLAEYLDLVALGTVADVVPLDKNNRVLVENGLRRIRTGKCAFGIKALIDVSGRDQQRLASSDLAFTLGPRLNAAGRLDDMSLGIECLLTENYEQALSMAQELHFLNQQRREIEEEMQQQAQRYLDSIKWQLQPTAGILVYDPGWHQGVTGILASRIKEKLNRPVIAFAPADQDRILLKGSARSIPGLHIRDLLESIDSKHPEMIKKFGGHAMAAGLTLAASELDNFRQYFELEVEKQVSREQLLGIVETDGELESEYMTLETAHELKYVLPWGQGFPEPSFDGEFEVMRWQIVGKKHLKLHLRPQNSYNNIEAIAFNQADKQLKSRELIRAVYKLDVNYYQGVETLQLLINQFERKPDDESQVLL